jgi:hypothetical protein
LDTAAYLYRMSTNSFLLIVTAIILTLLGSLLVQKYEDCAERGGKACPTSFRNPGVSMDPYQQSRSRVAD